MRIAVVEGVVMGTSENSFSMEKKRDFIGLFACFVFENAVSGGALMFRAGAGEQMLRW